MYMYYKCYPGICTSFFQKKSPDLVKFELYCRNNEFLKTGTLYSTYSSSHYRRSKKRENQHVFRKGECEHGDNHF